MRKLVCVLVVVVIFGGAGQLRANLLVNGSFEQGTFVPNIAAGAMSLDPGSTAITGWTTFNAELTWDDNANNFSVSASDGLKCLDLTGYHDSFPFGGIEQSIATTVGQVYHLAFDLGTNPIYGEPTLTAFAGGNSFGFTFNPPGVGMQWQRCGFDFTATSDNSLIGFVGNSPSWADIGLDNVSVTANSVPEPSNLLIWSLLGGFGIALASWRRKRAA